MTALCICGMICVTFVLSFMYLLNWIKDMAEQGLPMFTHGVLEWKPKQSTDAKTNVIGFEGSTDEPPIEEKKSDKEEKAQTLTDMTSTVSALLRGEIDIDEI